MGGPRDLRHMLGETDATFILDGGLATELERKGCDLSGELWSAAILQDKPELIEEVHLDFFKAGADIAISASYQASIAGLMEHGNDVDAAQARALISKSAAIAISAKERAVAGGIARPLYVAGSIGPYGAYLADGSEYRGDYELSLEEFKEFHRPRMEALMDAGVDLLAIETIPSYPEALALLDLIGAYPGLVCWISFTLRDGKNISDGTGLDKIAAVLSENEQVLALGINCIPPEIASEALQTIRSHTTKPLVVYPNSGEMYDAVSKRWKASHNHSNLATQAPRWKGMGARFIGGCCRTSPDDIQAIRSTLP